MRTLFTFFSILTFIPSLYSAPDAQGIKTANLKGAEISLMNNHDPEVERQHLDLLPGYEINLFASEPMFANPIHMVWDSRGRLWVACSWSYPQLKPGDIANDKIIILEDTNGDGKADKSTVFAEGLYMPTGIELIEGGCLVAQTPDVLLLKDTDGDDIADSKEIALTGFGIEDSHHSASAWRRGPGGWIYFQEGIFLHTQVETQRGMVYNYNGGVYQYNPRTQELNVFAKVGVGNPWGHVFDKWGQSFLVDNPRVIHLSPSTGNSGEKINVNTLIKTEKQCGGDLVTGTHLPDELQGQLLSGRFKSRTVIRYEFVEDGAGFGAYVKEPLVSSRHPNFRPVDVKIGPDGAVYIADWYNSIINHAQHDFRDPRRDHTHGRIWRVTAKNRPLTKKVQLFEQPSKVLLDHLKSPEAWVRHQAKFELSKKDPDQLLKQIETWVDGLSKTDPEYDHHLVEAMWTCQNIERVSEKILTMVLTAQSGHARSSGARILRYWHSKITDPISWIQKLCNDAFPRVRMEAILSAGFIQKAEAFPAMLMALNHDTDKFIDNAIPQSIKALEPYWRPAMEAGLLSFHQKEHQDYAEQKAGLGFSKRLASFIEKTRPSAKDIEEIKNDFFKLAQLEDIKLSIKAIKNKNTSTIVSVTLLKAMQRMDRTQSNEVRKVLKQLTSILKHEQTVIASGVAKTLGHLKINHASKSLLSILNNREKPSDLRRNVALALGAMQNSQQLETLRALSSDEDPELRAYATYGLIQADIYDGAKAVAQLFQEEPKHYDPAEYMKLLFQQRSGEKSFLKYLQKDRIHLDTRAAIINYHHKTGQLSRAMQKVFTQSSRDSLSVSLIKEPRKQLIQDIEQKGNPVNGEMIYRRPNMACTSCHSIGSVGPSIGPNLVAVGSGAKTSYIIEAILEPNESIAEHYENMQFIMKDNSVKMGVITFKSDSQITYRDSSLGGKEVTLNRQDILSQKLQPSLMPAGLCDQLKSRQEFLDLAKFISLLGKPGAYANDESPVIRKWRVAPTNETKAKPNSDISWLPAYSLVNGELPSGSDPTHHSIYAEGYVNVQVPGKVNLKINQTDGLNLWLDGQLIRDLDAPLTLAKGRRTLTFSVDHKKRQQKGLRVELESAPGSKAKFTPEGGI